MVLTPQLVTLLITTLLTYGPEAYMAISNVLKKANPTLEDIDALAIIVNTPLHPVAKTVSPVLFPQK
jgi:hypothetical protein